MPHISVLAEARSRLALLQDLVKESLDHLESLTPYTGEFAQQAWVCHELAASRDQTKTLVEWLELRVNGP